jgi:hypothetical protein
VLSLAVEVFLNQADTEMLAALSLPRHPDNIPQPVLHERIKVPNAAFGHLQGASICIHKQLFLMR